MAEGERGVGGMAEKMANSILEYWQGGEKVQVGWVGWREEDPG